MDRREEYSSRARSDRNSWHGSHRRDHSRDARRSVHRAGDYSPTGSPSRGYNQRSPDELNDERTIGRREERGHGRRRRFSNSPSASPYSRSPSRERPRRRHSPSPSRRHRRSSPRGRRHEKEFSPPRRSRQPRSRSRSPVRDITRHRSGSPRHHRRHHRRSEGHPRKPANGFTSHKPLPSQEEAFASAVPGGEAGFGHGRNGGRPSSRERRNFENTGLLATERSSITLGDTTVELKHQEPLEARKPPREEEWRLFEFKGDESLQTLDLSTQSCWLFGRETIVVDVPLHHHSCSKQHGAIQFRYIETVSELGDKDGRVRPYYMDLGSSNGTFINDKEVSRGKYVELFDKDLIRFGHSSREYVLMLVTS